jgi:glycerol uptake facilitator protein
MGAKWFGEFVGTAVLVLLGNGVVANVLLKEIQSGRCGLADDFHWLGVCYCFRRIRSDRMRQPGPSLEPGGDFRCCDRNRRFLEINSVPGGADAGRYGRRVSRVAELPAPLEPNGKSCAKLTCFATMPAIQDFGATLLSEIIGTFMLVLGVVAISSKKVAISGPCSGPRAPISRASWYRALFCLSAEPPVMRLVRPVALDPV